MSLKRSTGSALGAPDVIVLATPLPPSVPGSTLYAYACPGEIRELQRGRESISIISSEAGHRMSVGGNWAGPDGGSTSTPAGSQTIATSRHSGDRSQGPWLTQRSGGG